jgi:hypothetical protein
VDLSERSRVVHALEKFQFDRAYYNKDDAAARKAIDSIVREELANGE